MPAAEDYTVRADAAERTTRLTDKRRPIGRTVGAEGN